MAAPRAARDARYRARREIRRIQAEAYEEIKRRAANTMILGLQRGFVTGIQLAAEDAGTWARNFAAVDPALKEKMFYELGQSAQRSMLSAYDQVVTAREGPASKTAYRAGEGRLAGGILRTALQDPAFFEASPEGLAFGNISLLSETAKHWGRIAFGAGPRGKGVHDSVRLDFGGSIGTLTLDVGPRPGFTMPWGVWVAPGGGEPTGKRGDDLFYPIRRAVAQAEHRGGASDVRRPRRTQGIEGADFFRAALETLSIDLPTAYRTLLEDMSARSRRSLKGRKVTVVQTFGLE